MHTGRKDNIMKKRYQKGGLAPSKIGDYIRKSEEKKAAQARLEKLANKKKLQKGGKVKSSLRYKPGFPTTGDKPSPYDLKTLNKAITRDSTTVADRGIIGDFLDPGVTSSSTGPSPQYDLQINREYRDKVTGADDEKTAKKINIMKNKKQLGGTRMEEGVALPDRLRHRAKPMTGQETKDLGKKKLKTGRKNRRKARDLEGGVQSFVKARGKGQRKEGRALKKEGRKIKRSERRAKSEAEMDKTEGWLQHGGEVEFGKPKKKQEGGKVVGAKPEKGYDYRADSSDASSMFSNEDLLAINKKNRTKRKRADAQGGQGDFRKPTAQEQRDFINAGKGNYDTARQSPGERYNRAIRQSDAQDMPTKTVTSLTRGKDDKSLKKQKGGKLKKKQLGGIMGAIGGAKGGGGIGGALKGALGGGMLGRTIGAVKGAMGGGGLQGAMQGFRGGAFGNSQAMGGGGGAAAGGGAQQPAADPAAEAVPGAMKRGGLKDRRRKRATKKAVRKANRGRSSGKKGILGRTGTRNCVKGDC